MCFVIVPTCICHVDIDYISADLVLLFHISAKNAIEKYAAVNLHENKPIHRFSLDQKINKLKFVRNINR
jgi:hypothetical protein